MAIDTLNTWSPGWWLQRSWLKLHGKQRDLEILSAYYDGNPPLPTSAPNAQTAYAAFQKKARLNLAEMMVEATLNRMKPVGFATAVNDDPGGDEKARRIWEDNGLQIESKEVHRNMLVRRNGYTIVGPPDPETGSPVITSEDPRQVVTFHDPVRQARVRAGAKFFYDSEMETELAYLYLPGRVWRAFREAKYTWGRHEVSFSASSWNWDYSPGYGGADGMPLPQGNEDVVPIVRFRNKDGKGDFETHVDDIDRINHLILQRMVIATFQAFKQRAIKVDNDVMPEKNPETGEVIDYDKIFSADPGALWKIPAAAELWESGQVDLTGILEAVKQDVRDFCAATFTPLYYTFPDAANGSAEGAQTMREGAVLKADDRVERATVGWNQTMALAFRFSGQPGRAKLSRIKTLWAPTERYSLAERADAASKAQTDLSRRGRLERIWQLTPAEIAEEEQRLEEERQSNPTPPPSAPPVPVPDLPGPPAPNDPAPNE